MRVRAQDANGDMTFGSGQNNFLVNTPAAVGQLVYDRLRLKTSEWFLDLTDGTPWSTQILGVRTAATRDAAIKRRILSTPGVSSIVDYSSSLVDRKFTVTAVIATIYGVVTMVVPL